MRLSLISLLACAGLSIAAPSNVDKRSVFGKNAHPDGRLFNINGKTQYFAGTNAWWLGRLQDADIATVLSQMASSSLLVVRVWGFGNVNNATAAAGTVYFQVLNSTGNYINYDKTYGLGRLDSVVKYAEKYNVKLVLPLLNNWDDLGGINTYSAAFGSNATTFYTNQKAQAAYKSYIKTIVNRYKSSNAIFAWELCNEPRCHGCDTSVIYNWASGISAYIKSLDPTHMVTLGDEGWLPGYGDGSYAYSTAEGVDFAKNLKIPTLDYGTFHQYPTSWGYNASFGDPWLAAHDAVGKAAKKPIIAEEYGWPYANNRTAIESEWQSFILSKTGIAADQKWQWGDELATVKSEEDDYAVYYNTTKGSDYQILVTQHAKAMLAKRP